MFSINVFSGSSASFPVSIDIDEMVAVGNTYAARSAENDIEFIGCGRIVDELSPFPDYVNYAFCQAEDAEGVFVGCLTSNPEMMEVLSTNNAYSYIKFSWYDDDPVGDPTWHTCSQVYISSQSQYLPFTPVVKEKTK